MSVDSFSWEASRPSEASAHSLLMATPFPFVPVATDVPQGHRPLSTEQLQSFLASKSPSEDELVQSALESVGVVTAAVKELIMDGKKIPPALRLVRDALCRYQGVSSPKRRCKPDPSVDRERLARARRTLYPSPELSQADPVPAQECRATSRSPFAGPATPWRPSTSGHAQFQAFGKRPLTSPVLSALPQVPGSRLARTAGSRRNARIRIGHWSLRADSSESSIDSSPREGAKHYPKKLSQRMAYLAGRLHHKVYTIRSENKGECALAFSCRKRLVAARIQRQEEKNLATAAIHSRQIEEWGSNPSPTSPTSSTGANKFAEVVNDVQRMSAKGMFKTASMDVEKSDEKQAAPEPKTGKFTSFEAHKLSCDFNLPGGHVTQAWKLFKRYDTNNDDLLSPYEFQLLLRHVLRERFPSAKDVPRELFKEAIEIQHTDLAVSFIDFLTWITRNAFQECLLLDHDQRFMRLIARKFQVKVTDVETVKRHFDTFTHRSGKMDYRQFYKLLALLLNLTDVSSLPESRVKSFWRELGGDHNGIVEFEDFIPWYLACFAAGEGSPLVNFYKKIRPIPLTEFYE